MRREIAPIVAAVLIMALAIALLKFGRTELNPLEEFAESADEVRQDIKFGQELSERYLIIAEGSQFLLTPAQLLHYAENAILTISQGVKFSIGQPISVDPPSAEDGDWGACWRKLSREDYLSLALEVENAVNLTGRVPGAFETSIGKIRFRDALFTFVRILSSYRETGELPRELLFAPAPFGTLSLDNLTVPSSYAYFLLPSDYVVTGSPRINMVLSEVIKPSYDNRRITEELCTWVSTNVKTELYVGMPRTSEDVLRIGKGKCTDLTNLYLALVRAAGIPARGVSGTVLLELVPQGFELIDTTPEGKHIVGHAWAEVYLPGEGWVTVDPTTGSFGKMTFEINPGTEPTRETWREALVAYEMMYERI